MPDRCEHCGKIEKDNEHLKSLMMNHLWEITTLKNEIRYLKGEIENRQVGELEKRLILVCKDVINKLDSNTDY